ncbi:hypothetical protein ACWIGW_32065 [Nocardia brasiliensis]
MAEAGREGGPVAAFHAATYAAIDSYLDVLDGLDRDIKQVEQEVFSKERGNSVERIHQLHRAVAELEQAIIPLGDEPLERLVCRKIPVWLGDDAYGEWHATTGPGEMDRQVRGMTARVPALRAMDPDRRRLHRVPYRRCRADGVPSRPRIL